MSDYMGAAVDALTARDTYWRKRVDRERGWQWVFFLLGVAAGILIGFGLSFLG